MNTTRLNTLCAALLAIPAIAAAQTAGGEFQLLSGSGGWIGDWVDVKIHIKGDKLHVDKVWSEERWSPTDQVIYYSYRYGHTQLYWVDTNEKRHHITNNSDHTVSFDALGQHGAQNTSVSVNRDYPDGSRLCARFWVWTGSQYKNYGSSCMWIHD